MPDPMAPAEGAPDEAPAEGGGTYESAKTAAAEAARSFADICDSSDPDSIEGAKAIMAEADKTIEAIQALKEAASKSLGLAPPPAEEAPAPESPPAGAVVAALRGLPPAEAIGTAELLGFGRKALAVSGRADTRAALAQLETWKSLATVELPKARAAAQVADGERRAALIRSAIARSGGKVGLSTFYDTKEGQPPKLKPTWASVSLAQLGEILREAYPGDDAEPTMIQPDPKPATLAGIPSAFAEKARSLGCKTPEEVARFHALAQRIAR